MNEMSETEALEWVADAMDAWLSDHCSIMTEKQISRDVEAIGITRKIAKRLKDV